MAKGRKRTVIEKKAKPKQWVPILAPELFNRVEVGQIPLSSADTAVGRVVTANLMNITRDMKQQNINIKFKVNEVKEQRALTTIQSFKVMPAAVKRMTHRRVDVIEDSSVYFTKDKIAVRIKPVVFTRGNTSNSIRRAIRKGMRNLILRNVKKAKSEEVFRDALSNKIQYDIEKELSKLYPLKTCVIRELTLEPTRSRKKASAIREEEEVKFKKAASKDEEWEKPKTQPELPDQMELLEAAVKAAAEAAAAEPEEPTKKVEKAAPIEEIKEEKPAKEATEKKAPLKKAEPAAEKAAEDKPVKEAKKTATKAKKADKAE